jgi:hypothetical protein
VQGNLGRNTLNGFGATQVDLTLRRQFKLRERLSLQARADFFNIFNHPNFGPPINYLSSPLFGQSTQGASLGSGGDNGGLNPLYQIGGPRSAQLALKVVLTAEDRRNSLPACLDRLSPGWSASRKLSLRRPTPN